ncbi:MAG: hypothetical protein QM739_14130 [Propionivibrio sp.]
MISSIWMSEIDRSFSLVSGLYGKPSRSSSSIVDLRIFGQSTPPILFRGSSPRNRDCSTVISGM